MREIYINKVSMVNFFSVGPTPLILEFQQGLNLITGFNTDQPTEKNGVGKCLVPSTEINISIEDEMVLENFKNFVTKNSKNDKYLCEEY